MSRFKWTYLLTTRGLEYVYTKEGKRPNGKTILLHRYILEVPDGVLVDHINMNGLDNRRSNLRLCNKTQSQIHRHGWGKFPKGVIKGSSKKFGATVTLEGKTICIGLFDSIQEAKNARDKIMMDMYGEFYIP